jgi:hypothetical protein
MACSTRHKTNRVLPVSNTSSHASVLPKSHRATQACVFAAFLALVLVGPWVVDYFMLSSLSPFPDFDKAKWDDMSVDWSDFGDIWPNPRGRRHISSTGNSSLGFGKVVVVLGHSDEHEERHDIAHAAAGAGFLYEMHGASPRKSRAAKDGPSVGHGDVVRKVVEEGLQSVLILEDDVRWDDRIKKQLQIIADGAKRLLSDMDDIFFPASDPGHSFPDVGPGSPYGDDWDVLWLGHCDEVFPETLPENRDLGRSDVALLTMKRKFAIWNDPTAARDDMTTEAGAPRWVHVTGSPSCSSAYALSQRGARKVLEALALYGGEPFDQVLANLCRHAVAGWEAIVRSTLGRDTDVTSYRGRNMVFEPEEDDWDPGLKCLSVTPSLFFR